MRSLALAILILAAACGGGDSPHDAAALACTEPPPTTGVCDTTVNQEEDCPSLESLCESGPGFFECCFCGESGDWEILNLDCFPTPDAGPPDAGAPDAGP